MEKLATRPVEVQTDTTEIAAGLVDLKEYMSRRRTVVRDKQGRIVGVEG